MNKLADIDIDSMLRSFLKNLLSHSYRIIINYNFSNYDKNHKYYKFIIKSSSN